MQRLTAIFENIEKLHTELKLSEENSHYLKNVLRYSKGDKIKIYSSREYGIYEITEIGKRTVTCSLISEIMPLTPPPDFTVYQSILKREYMDFLMEKYGEIGVGKVIVIKTEYSQKKLPAKTLQRYNKLLIKGALQAEHNFLPQVTYLENLKDINDTSKMKLCFYEREIKKRMIKKVSNSVSIFIGPEGGFTKNELDILSDKQFEIISPIKSILKAETAGIIFAGLIKVLMDCNEYL